MVESGGKKKKVAVQFVGLWMQSHFDRAHENATLASVGSTVQVHTNRLQATSRGTWREPTTPTCICLWGKKMLPECYFCNLAFSNPVMDRHKSVIYRYRNLTQEYFLKVNTRHTSKVFSLTPPNLFSHLSG